MKEAFGRCRWMLLRGAPPPEVLGAGHTDVTFRSTRQPDLCRRGTPLRATPRTHHIARVALLAAALGVIVACAAPAPRAIVYGSDQCAHCHMTVVDRRFAAELVLPTGKVIVFDDIGCLRDYLASATEREQRGTAWVHDLTGGEGFVRADSMILIRTTLHTPMGSGLVATQSARSADSLVSVLDGTRLTWAQVRASH